MDAAAVNLRKLPSVDEVTRSPATAEAAHHFGCSAVTQAVHAVLAEARAARMVMQVGDIMTGALARLGAGAQLSLRPAFNLTGTALHTNLGRALMAEEAVDNAVTAMRNAMSLEFDLASGKRGERDDYLRGLLRELTGAEDATVVNNNAPAVLIVLNLLAKGREAIVSCGELIGAADALA
jgi:L-seryl-tRNA(Ser) seleniumtransferase